MKKCLDEVFFEFWNERKRRFGAGSRRIIGRVGKDETDGEREQRKK